jgi:hypothetical protein
MYDDITRRIVADAIAEADMVQRQYDIFQANFQRQQQQQQEREEREAAHAAEQRIVHQWLTQSAGDEVRTDFYSERDRGGNSGTGNDEAWDRWVRAHVNVLRQEVSEWINDKYVPAFNELVAHGDKDIETINANFARRVKADEDLKAAIDELRTEVAALRFEVDELRAEINGDGKERTTVIPMLTFRGRDAA